jgi:hypothetical protein
MNKRTEEAILSDGKENPVAEVTDAQQLGAQGIEPAGQPPVAPAAAR